MAEPVKAPVEESKETKPVETKTEEKPVVEAPKEEVKVGELLKKEEPKETKMVPEAALLEYKKENKEVLRELKELREVVAKGATKSEVTASVKELMSEYPDSKEFIEKFYGALKAEVQAERASETKVTNAKEEAKRIDTIFNEQFDKVMEAYPEYKGIVNKDVIKTLSLDPKNASKTFPKILEESYGHLIQGKKTIEKTMSGGSKSDAKVDFKRAARDPEYFKEIKANPDMLKEYNADLETRMRF